MSVLIPPAMAWKYGAKCSVNQDGSGIEVWEHPTEPKPSLLQIIEILEEYKAYLKAVEYRTKRAAEYPPIGDQLDVIWKVIADLIDGTENHLAEAKKMIETVDAVKAKYPAPKA